LFQVSLLRRSFCPPLLVRLPERNQILYAPQPICDASGHSWRHAKCTVNLYRIVSEIIQGRGSRMIFQLPGEAVRQAGVAPHCAAYSPILALYKRRGNVPKIRSPADFFHRTADASSGRVPRFILRWRTIMKVAHYPSRWS
jgi:hypothetical protein